LTNLPEKIYFPRSHLCGEMAEWLIATVLKTVVPQGTQGSNPCLSAMKNKKLPLGSFVFFMIEMILGFEKRAFAKGE
jgi:hypothetical protein